MRMHTHIFTHTNTHTHTHTRMIKNANCKSTPRFHSPLLLWTSKTPVRINVVQVNEGSGSKEGTALIAAASRGHLPCVSRCLEQEIDIDATDDAVSVLCVHWFIQQGKGLFSRSPACVNTLSTYLGSLTCSAPGCELRCMMRAFCALPLGLN
jgi:hypothetical protein